MRFHPSEFLLYWFLRTTRRLDSRAKSLTDFNLSQVRRILLVSSTALGDTVLSTAAMVAMRQRFPAARITALIHRDYVPLFRSCDFLDDVIAYHGGYRRFFCTLRALRRVQPDVALILHGNEPQATPLAYLAGARFIFKLPNTSRFAFLLSNQVPRLTWSDMGHGMMQRLKVAELAGAKIEGARMHLPVPDSTREMVARWLAEQGVMVADIVIGLQAGASSGGRMWPVAHFVALAKMLLAAHPACRFVITGAPHEQARCEAIAQDIGAAACVAAGALPIEALPALVDRCAVLVTGDTGVMHVAVAVATPAVALFAVSDPAASGPAYDFDKHIVIHRMNAAGARSKTDDDHWMAQIMPEEVAAAVRLQLARRQKGPHV